jgi:hypothetical protein
VRDNNSPHQEEAVRALGEIPHGGGAAVILSAFNAHKPAVRVAAYLTLMRVAPNMLQAVEIPYKFQLAVVASTAEPFVFVSRQLRPRVIIFGHVTIQPPLLVNTPRYLATVRDGETKMELVSKLYGPDQRVETSLKLVDMVEVMAGVFDAKPDKPRTRALDLSYSDVVGFLDRAYSEGALRAPLVLEAVEFVGQGGPQPTGKPGGRETDIIIPGK